MKVNSIFTWFKSLIVTLPHNGQCRNEIIFNPYNNPLKAIVSGRYRKLRNTIRWEYDKISVGNAKKKGVV